MTKSNRSKEYQKRGEKRYTKDKVNVPTEKKLKKAFKGNKMRIQEVHTCDKMDVSKSKKSEQSLDDSDALGKTNDI